MGVLTFEYNELSILYSALDVFIQDHREQLANIPEDRMSLSGLRTHIQAEISTAEWLQRRIDEERYQP